MAITKGREEIRLSMLGLARTIPNAQNVLYAIRVQRAWISAQRPIPTTTLCMHVLNRLAIVNNNCILRHI